MPCCTKGSPASRCFPNQKQNAIRDSADGAVVHVVASDWERAGSGELAGGWRLQRWPTAGFPEGGTDAWTRTPSGGRDRARCWQGSLCVSRLVWKRQAGSAFWFVGSVFGRWLELCLDVHGAVQDAYDQ